jgi:hypothetical protein
LSWIGFLGDSLKLVEVLSEASLVPVSLDELQSETASDEFDIIAPV